MNKTDMLHKLLQQAGWKVTTETDEDGYRIAVAAGDTKAKG